MHPLIANLKGKLIVSVQAYPGEPMRHPETMAQIARAAEIGAPPPSAARACPTFPRSRAASMCP